MTRKKLSNEHKNKISEALKGKHHSEETKRKIREASKGNTNRKGIKCSEEHKRKISEANRGNIYNKGKKHSDITKKKMSEAREGMKLSDETKKKMSEAKKGKIGYWKDKKHPHSEETKRKIGEAHKGKHLSEEHKRKISEAQKGEKCYSWKGGISFEIYPQGWDELLKDSIRQRDGYVCQICGIHQDEMDGIFKKLDVHHIDYNKDNLNPDNLISLCKSCHAKTNHNREYWIEYFRIDENRIITYYNKLY